MALAITKVVAYNDIPLDVLQQIITGIYRDASVKNERDLIVYSTPVVQICLYSFNKSSHAICINCLYDSYIPIIDAINEEVSRWEEYQVDRFEGTQYDAG